MSHSKLSFWEVKLYIFLSIKGSDVLFWCKIKVTTEEEKSIISPSDIYFSNAYKMDSALVTKFLSSVIIDIP